MTLKLPVTDDVEGARLLLPAGRNAYLSLLLFFCLLTGSWCFLMPEMAAAEDRAAISSHDSRTVANPISPLKRMQRFISRADGDRCPMYPTCSHYASQAFAREGMLMGWVLTCDRLLRCGRDEKHLAKPIRVRGQKYAHDSLDANTFWWKAP